MRSEIRQLKIKRKLLQKRTIERSLVKLRIKQLQRLLLEELTKAGKVRTSHNITLDRLNKDIQLRDKLLKATPGAQLIQNTTVQTPIVKRHAGRTNGQ